MAEDIGFKASPPGVDVIDGNVKDIAFTSAYEMHKIHTEAHYQPQAAFEIDHGLNYWPFFLHYRGGDGRNRSGGQINRWSLLVGSTTSQFTTYFIFYERSFI